MKPPVTRKIQARIVELGTPDTFHIMQSVVHLQSGVRGVVTRVVREGPATEVYFKLQGEEAVHRMVLGFGLDAPVIGILLEKPAAKSYSEWEAFMGDDPPNGCILPAPHKPSRPAGLRIE